MISSIFKNLNSKTTATNRGISLGLGQNTRHSARKPSSKYADNSYIDLGWVSGLIESLERLSNLSTIAYQGVALVLLTLGLVLAFQNFSTFKSGENVIIINKAQIARTEEKRIWTDTASIDKAQNKYNFNITTAPVAQVPAINADCEKVALDANTQFSSDQIDKCSSKTDKKPESGTEKSAKKITPTKTATKTIKVAAGENLSYLALTNKVSVSQIVELNNLKSNNLKLGQVLLVPAEKQI